MNEQGSISGVWREALAIIRCYPSAVVVPGAVLGALAEAPAYFIADRLLLDHLLTYLAPLSLTTSTWPTLRGSRPTTSVGEI